MDFKELILKAANEPTKSLNEELRALARHEKFKTMRESCDRFHMLAWHFVISAVPVGDDESMASVIEQVKKNAADTWGSDAQSMLNSMGIKTKRDVVDILNIALEHGVINGKSEKCPDGDLY